MKKFFVLIITSSALFLSSCSNDDDTGITSKNFTVTVENAAQEKSSFDTGTTGLIMPGQSESFSFYAGKGHALQFATMYVQSNDIFVSPDDTGIPLYNADGSAVIGDITDKLSLWDAGTEVNEEPGVGPNQAPRQSAGNTGIDENGSVALLSDVTDGFNYPMVGDLIEVTLTHDGGSRFTANISNISSASSIPSPFAPGVWAIHNLSAQALFVEGSAASVGLEGLAEDGDIASLATELENASGFVSPFAPGAYTIGARNELFESGQIASEILESLAEDGNPSGFSNIFNTPDGASSPAPIFPGQSYSFSFSAEDGDQLSLATMLVQSNDWFVGANDIALFIDGIGISGDITEQLRLYDSGTEIDEFAGAGNNQAPRQTGPNTGSDENGFVERETNPGPHVPALADLLRVTITAN